MVTPLASSGNLLASPFNCNPSGLGVAGTGCKRRETGNGSQQVPRTQDFRADTLRDSGTPTSGVKKVMRGHPLPGGAGIGPGRAPEGGPLGRGGGEEQDTHSVLRCTQPGGGLRCDYKNDGGLAVLKNGEIQTKEGHKCYLLARHSRKS